MFSEEIDKRDGFKEQITVLGNDINNFQFPTVLQITKRNQSYVFQSSLYLPFKAATVASWLILPTLGPDNMNASLSFTAHWMWALCMKNVTSYCPVYKIQA